MTAVLSPPLGIHADMRKSSSGVRSDTPATVVDAVERLARSRARLHAAMLPPPKAQHGAPGPGVASFAGHLIERVKNLPGAAVLVDAVESWWAEHPLRTAATVAAQASRKIAAPIAERNPLLLVGGAFLFGAAVILTRPWRWMLRPVLFAGLVPALATRAIRKLSVDSLVDMFAWYSAPRAAAAHSDPKQQAAPPPQADAQARPSAPMQP